jgi:hypothetical protein
VAPTDAERRGIPPIFWAAMDKSKGGTAPQDAPLAPPAMDPAKRTAAALIWPRVLPEAVPNRPLQELVSPIPDLDPDIAMWPVTLVQRWPFAGSPSEGIWPKGWMGVDNTATVWVCTVAGEPGTWVQLAASGSAGWPASNGTGPGNLTAETPGGDTVGYKMTDQGSGGIALWSHGSGNLDLTSDNSVVIGCGLTGVTDTIKMQAAGSALFLSIDQTRLIIDISADEVNQFLLRNLFITDPAVADAVWSDNGVLVLSGSTANLRNDSGSVSTVGSTGGAQNLVTTASLAIGKWLINASFTWDSVADTNEASLGVIAGTATASFSGAANASGTAASASVPVTGAISCIATVTVAGTLILQGVAANGGNWGLVGFTAVKIA